MAGLLTSFDLGGAIVPADVQRMMRASGAQAGGIDAVAAELHRWAVEPFDLGRDNCGLSVIGYAARVLGCAVPAWLFGFGAFGAWRLMLDDARFLAVADRALAEMGCEEIAAPARGDVALVRLPGSGLTACICTGPLWAARGDRAAVVGAGELVRAWRVACRRP